REGLRLMNERKARPVIPEQAPIVGLWPVELEVEANREKREALGNFKLLDVHTWSDHPEANQFIDAIYAEHFEGRKAAIKKRHLKVVLLDLYVTWSEVPDRVIAVSRNNNDYDAGSRYNELHISRLTIDVLDRLIEVGLVEQAIGFKDRDTGVGRVSRIWPTQKLIEVFRKARFSPLDVGSHEDRLSVILRDDDPVADNDGEGRAKREIEYEPDDNTQRMSDMLRDYNALLRRTFIDIPTLGAPWIDIQKGNEVTKLAVSQRDKFVRRIFNRGSFGCGGRFYGGWWERCPKEWRGRIFIDDQPTNEIDFSGLHIVMLYAQQGIPYWAEIGGDPYDVPGMDFLHDKAERRSTAKSLMLVLLNARDAGEAYAAFRNKAEAGTKAKTFTNGQLALVHGALADKHPRIAEKFGADAGVHLMNLDSMVTERILTRFLKQGIPALSIHDSYIVPAGNEPFLRLAMCEAFEEVMGVPLLDQEAQALKENLERVEDLWGQLMGWMPYDNVPGQQENEDAYRERAHPVKTARYLHAWEQFRAWRNPV
ncbi:MAG: hypothetical protein AB1744_03535, partial [Candidatus Zixiibacteriota bacterium]